MSVRRSGARRDTVDKSEFAVGEQGGLTLFVAPGSVRTEILRTVPAAGPIAFADIESVPVALVATPPDVIVSPAMSDRFDCIDLARMLHKAGYRGAYRVPAGALPRPEMVEAEVAAAFPGLDFAVISDRPVHRYLH
ncbi:hypothetical protein DXV76_09755 [Rhodobacteraceae bacterium CCMM004]|nr:hypothetical protein DXV76_09755 [Rhodobacteraceae bacterium CCMM004]